MFMPRFPDFVIGGNVRCGTSSTRRNLRRHPDIFFPSLPSRSKFADQGALTGEIHFYDDPQRWSKGLTWYKAWFMDAGFRVAGDKTPNYVSTPQAVYRIARHMPNVKFIVLFRDPVTRLWSNWNLHNNFRLRHGLGHHTFDEFISLPTGNRAVVRGNYGNQMRRLVSLFPPENIHVEFTEISMQDPYAAARRMHVFLGVEPGDYGEIDEADPNTKLGGGYDGVPEGVERRFRAFYRPQVELLYDILKHEHVRSWL